MILIDGFPIDSAITEEHKLDSEVTDFPVETGSNKTDHARPLPDEVTINGFVSDSPFDDVLAARRASGHSTDTTEAINATGFVRFSDQARAFLELLRDTREPVAITTSLKTYTSMYMTGLTIDRNAQNGNALEFRSTWKKVTFTSNNQIRVAVPSAGGQVNAGAKNGERLPGRSTVRATSFQVSARASGTIKKYGQPLVTDTTPPAGGPAGKWDHFDSTNLGIFQDGFVQYVNGGSPKYTPNTVDGQATKFDAASSAWKNSKGDIVRTVPRDGNNFVQDMFDTQGRD